MAVAMIGSMAGCKKSGRGSSGLTEAANGVMEALISRNSKKAKKTGDFSEDSIAYLDTLKACDALSAVMDKATFEIDEDSIKETKKGTSVKVVVTLPDAGDALDGVSNEDEFIENVEGQKEKKYAKIDLTLKFEVDEDKYTLTNGDDVVSDLYGGDLEKVNNAFGATKALPIETDDVPPTTDPVPETSPTPVPTDPPKASSNVYDVIVYQDDKTVIHFNKIDSDGAHFTVENLASYEVTVQCDSFAFDGVAVLSHVMSDKIAGGTSGEVVIKFDLDNVPQQIATVSGQLNIVDFETYDNTYAACFDTTVIDPSVTATPTPTGIQVYADEFIQVNFREVTSEGALFELINLTGQDVEVRLEALSINGRNIVDPTWYDCELAPHSVGVQVSQQKDTIDPSEAVGAISALFEVNNDVTQYNTYYANVNTTVIDANVSFTAPALEGTVLYEDANVRISYTGMSAEGPVLGVENLTDSGLIVQAESLSINMVGIYNVYMSYYVAAHSVCKFVAEGPVDAAAPVGTIAGGFIIANPADRKTNYMVHLDTVVIDSSVTVAPQAAGTLVYEDKNVKIYYKELREKGVVFDVENLTPYCLTIQDRDTIVNGVEMEGMGCSDEIAPHSITEVVVVSKPDTSMTVTSLTFDFVVFSWDDKVEDYHVKAENVAIG